MQSLTNNEMPGYHYARIVAAALTIPDQDRRSAAIESAKALISHVPSQDEDIQRLRKTAAEFAQIISDAPQLAHDDPGGCYWPLRVLFDELDAAGVEYDPMLAPFFERKADR